MKKLFLTMACMIVAGLTFANHWTPIGGTQYNMTMSGIILIDGVEQMGTNLEVGAFCGEECRGSMMPEFFAPSQQFVVSLTVVSNQLSGEEIIFRLYDHSTQQELDLVSVNNTTFVNNAIIGTLGDWYEFSFNTPASTFELPITGYTGTADHYYLISSPIGEVSPGNVTGMTTGDFDLYYFDQAQELEWINIENGETPLAVGKGYLYANSANTTLVFSGTPYTGTGTFPLDYSDANPDEIMRGWNLVGNPYPNNASVDRDYYVMNEGGTELIAGTAAVAAMNGIFVKATAAGQRVTFTQNSNGKSQVAINVLKDRGAAIDRAIVRFDENSILPKFMLDSNNTKIYIPQSGDNYAVVSSGNVNSLPVNFKAKTNGTYTLSVDITEVRMEYLHLIDNMTGADVDLLVQPDYQFNATNHDYEARFTLVFRAATGVEEQSQESFCFVNGRNLYFCEDVEGTTLSLVDMTGRTLRHETLKGNGVSLSDLSEGIYVVRLTNGNDTKVQKIVVK